MISVLIPLVLALMAAAAGYLIGDHKHRPVLGTVLGLLLGLIGIAVIIIIPARRPVDVALVDTVA